MCVLVWATGSAWAEDDTGRSEWDSSQHQVSAGEAGRGRRPTGAWAFTAHDDITATARTSTTAFWSSTGFYYYFYSRGRQDTGGLKAES